MIAARALDDLQEALNDLGLGGTARCDGALRDLHALLINHAAETRRSMETK